MSEADGDDCLSRAELSAAREGCRIGNEIIVVEEAGSTNDLAWAAAERGAPEGFVVFAERQTAGRGQYGRRWESAPYLGLWFSVLLRPPITLRESPQLTASFAKVLAATIEHQTGCVAIIKPPNDIFAGQRKVAGILVEGRTARDGSYVAVAGVGMNVNQSAADFSDELRLTAGSLAMMTGRKISRTRLAITLLGNLEQAFSDRHSMR
jgi:BirA family biotin operon repressor/biotin-[acetyl-CoA-carboxylase] ligase